MPAGCDVQPVSGSAGRGVVKRMGKSTCYRQNRPTAHEAQEYAILSEHYLQLEYLMRLAKARARQYLTHERQLHQC